MEKQDGATGTPAAPLAGLFAARAQAVRADAIRPDLPARRGVARQGST